MELDPEVSDEEVVAYYDEFLEKNEVLSLFTSESCLWYVSKTLFLSGKKYDQKIQKTIFDFKMANIFGESEKKRTLFRQLMKSEFAKEPVLYFYNYTYTFRASDTYGQNDSFKELLDYGMNCGNRPLRNWSVRMALETARKY